MHMHTYLKGGRTYQTRKAMGSPVVARCKAVVVRSAGRMDVEGDRRAAEWDGGSAKAR